MYKYIALELFGWFIVIFTLIITLRYTKLINLSINLLKSHTKSLIIIALFSIGVIFILMSKFSFPIHFAMPPFMHAHTPDKFPPSLPILNLVRFFFADQKLIHLDNVGIDPNNVPAPITRQTTATVTLDIITTEIISEVAPGVFNNYWTYNNTVPGPMFRVKEGDTVIVNITNDRTSIHSHNIDFHSATGPGGGASVSNVKPGETKSFLWKALAPGLYVYHCATPNVSTHNAHGQYGLILVEPKLGLPPVDKEFYIMQGELYTKGGVGKKGLVAFDSQGLLDGIPSYITFNGIVEEAPRMTAKVGDKIRMYVGNGGVNLISSFHIIGEIFDVVYPEAGIGPNSAIHENVQTTAVLPGGATIVEFTLDVPGKYILVDHALARMNKGAWAILEVTGAPQPDIYKSLD